MRANWFKGIVILAILALLWALFTAPKRSKSMGEDIRGSLAAAGFTDTQVEMNGNVATLTGEAASDATKNEIGKVATETKCSKCEDKKTWHEVKNDITVKAAPAIPTQSPYTFSAIKSDDGSVVLNGWVQNQDQRDRVMARAKAAYGTVTDRTVLVANGAPNADWEMVLNQNIDDLKLLDTGRFAMRDAASNITGETGVVDLRDAIAARAASLTGYNGSATIKLTAPATGEIKDIEVCQTLLDDLKRGKKINFAYDKAEIRGAESFDLLNSLASAANQCSAFKINIEGHTDADGANSYNQRLSEARANLVVAYLSENGVERSRMSAIGYGETKPIADNTTDAGKAQNRRIEFIVTESE
ncbi:OmpA family protein [Hellea balneolensis]|uniref:OmpA family protein n=1 Tax=Hellea balneolensis TaxID=287478 RepID=UPI0004283BB9|nr:OmpA family protein [Hellea balneolensis]